VVPNKIIIKRSTVRPREEARLQPGCECLASQSNGAKSRGRSVQSGEAREPVVSTCRTQERTGAHPPERNERSRTRVARRRVGEPAVQAAQVPASPRPREPTLLRFGFSARRRHLPGGLQRLSSRSLAPTPVSRDRPGALSRSRPRVGSPAEGSKYSGRRFV
jgi:hypothetical protein